MVVLRNRRRLTEHRRIAGRIVRAIEQEYAGDEHSIGVLTGLRTEWMPVSELARTASGRRLLSAPPGLQVPAAVLAAEAAARRLPDTAPYEILETLSLGRLPFAREDVALLLRFATGARDPMSRARLTALVMPAVEAFVAAHGADALERQLRKALARLDSHRHDSDAERARARARLARLLAETGRPVRLDESLLQDGDNWGRAVRARVRRDFGDVAGLDELLAHLASATTGPRPSSRWTKRCRELLDRDLRSGELVRVLLETAARVEDGSRRAWGGLAYVYLTDANAVLVRGAIWAAGVVGEDWSADLIGELAEHAASPFEPGFEPRSVKVANAAIRQLAALESDAAVATLTELRAGIKHKTIAKQVEQALSEAAAAAGISKSQLLERQVPTFRLDRDGRREVAVGEATAIIERDRLSWRNAAGKPVKSVPVLVKEGYAAELRALRAEVKEIGKALGAQRLRIESLFAEERVWRLDEWRELYLEHPLVGGLAQRLIWTFDGVALFPLDVALVNAPGEQHEPPRDADVRLWHPLGAEPDEVAAWRRFLLDRELVQPFKQAFREIYLLAPAERETRTYSNRFAGHVLHYRQAYALVKARGWSVVALGPYDNDGGRQWRDFEAHGIRAEFWMEHADENWDEMDMIASLATTDQVRFSRLGEREPMPLEEVPPIVFSEAMRDVDLFVGVASIAADPTWVDRGEDRHAAYWREVSFGDLGESGVTRREVLREVVPQLTIADRCEVDGRYLVVRGDLRTYRIHLGSGNVLMEPNDEYLCIVPARGGRRAADVFLPFEDDSRLSVILSKAFLLAEDSQIRDRTITEQIRRR